MRLFVAIDIPDEVRAEVSELISKLRPACPKARWARIEGVHVTLKFIGETPDASFAQIKAALALVVPRPSIAIRFRGVGFFPNARRPRVFWAGVEAGPELAALAGAVEDVLHPLGVPRETRTFSPHLTLARFDPPRPVEELLKSIEKLGPFDFGSATADEFYVYQSMLKRGGSEYTRLANFPLNGSMRE